MLVKIPVSPPKLNFFSGPILCIITVAVHLFPRNQRSMKNMGFFQSFSCCLEIERGRKTPPPTFYSRHSIQQPMMLTALLLLSWVVPAAVQAPIPSICEWGFLPYYTGEKCYQMQAMAGHSIYRWLKYVDSFWVCIRPAQIFFLKNWNKLLWGLWAKR